MITKLRVTMPDGSLWDVPVSEIAAHRAIHFKDEFGGNELESLTKDTLPLFADDPNEILDWAANNMNWDMVSHSAKMVPTGPGGVDFQEGWVNGKKELL